MLVSSASSLSKLSTRRSFIKYTAIISGAVCYPGSLAKVLAENGNFLLTSPVFNAGEVMPTDHTQHGIDVSPPLSWQNLPKGTQELALVLEGSLSDKPRPFVHWVVYNIPVSINELPKALALEPRIEVTKSATITQGLTGWKLPGYRGPYPRGNAQEFRFSLYALNKTLNLPEGLDKDALLKNISTAIVDTTAFVVVAQQARRRRQSQ